MNRKGQGFLIEVFAMIFIFAIIISIIALNSMRNDGLIRLVQNNKVAAYSDTDILMIMHESVEAVTFADAVDKTMVHSSVFGCDDCEREYPYTAHITMSLIERTGDISMDSYRAVGRYKMRPPGTMDYAVDIAGIDHIGIPTGIFFPSTRGGVLELHSSPSRINPNIFMIMPGTDGYSVYRTDYAGEIVRGRGWRIMIRDIQGETDEGISYEGVDDIVE
jgi:hypothetical protein